MTTALKLLTRARLMMYLNMVFVCVCRDLSDNSIETLDSSTFDDVP